MMGEKQQKTSVKPQLDETDLLPSAARPDWAAEGALPRQTPTSNSSSNSPMPANGSAESDFASVADAISEFRSGRMVVVVDDPDRENEGDLIVPASFVTPEKMAFIIRHTGGVVCLAMTNALADQLQLPLAVSANTTRLQTAFTVPIEARTGITTGISAADRCRTVLTAANPDARPDDLARPGHVFPLRANDGGVLMRAGHTEAAVDLCRLAGLREMAVLSELMDTEKGEMLRGPQLIAFAKHHGLSIITIADLIEHRRRTERLMERIAAVAMPTRFGDFTCVGYRSRITAEEHIAFVHGFSPPPSGVSDSPMATTPILVRVHSECLTGDVFHSLRCDCGEQLETALRHIQSAPHGVLLYLRQEGRGIGLGEKLKAYALQDDGLDTVEANEHLGFAADPRNYGMGAQILVDLGVRQIRLLTNNPRKFSALQGYGLQIIERIPLEIPPTAHNHRYLHAKRHKLGHLLSDDTAAADAPPPTSSPLG